MPDSAPADRESLRKQVVETERRHAIATLLGNYGIPLTDILFKPGDTKVIHTPTHEYFVFGIGRLSDNLIQAAYCSRMEQSGESRFASGITFAGVFDGFRNWCASLRRYTRMIATYRNAPDPFEVAARAFTGTELAKAASALPNDSLTASELTRVSAQLSELKQYLIRNGDVQGDKMALLDAKVDYLIEASERLGKKDWSNVFITTLISIIIAGVFAPDRAQELMDYGASLFAFLFQPYLIP